MKEFDLEAAKRGEKVCTRDGRPVRIICWDVKGDYMMAALIDCGDREEIATYRIDGRLLFSRETPADLMMAEGEE